MRHSGSKDRWEEGLRILARLIALRIQAQDAQGLHDGATSGADSRLPEQDAAAHDTASPETESEPELE